MDEKKELNVSAHQNGIRFFAVGQRHFNLNPYLLSSGQELIPQLMRSNVHHLTMSGEQWADCDTATLLKVLNDLSSSKITSLTFDWVIFINKIPSEIRKIFAVFQEFFIKKLAIVNIYGNLAEVTLKLYLILNYLQQSRVRSFIWDVKNLNRNTQGEQNFLYPWEQIPINFRSLKISNLCIQHESARYLSSLFKGLNLARICKLDLSYSITEEIDLSKMFHSIADMPLKFLYLRGNKLEIKSLEHIHRLKNLEYLDLEETGLNAQALEVVSFFDAIKKSRLKFLSLRKNKLSEIKINILSQALEKLKDSTVTHLDLGSNGFFSSPNYPVSELKLLIHFLPKTIRTITFHETEFPQALSDPISPKQRKSRLWLKHFPEPTQIILYKHNKIINPAQAKNRHFYAPKGLPAPTFLQLICFSIVCYSRQFTLNDLFKLPEDARVKIQEARDLMNAISFVNGL